MGRTFLLAAVLSTVLVSVLASPVPAQLAADAPPAPKYEVKDNGNLIIGGDVVVSCFQIGQEDPYLQEGGPEARACEAAGFGPAAGPPSGSAPTPAASASALPETGGPGSVVVLVPLALVLGGLLAFGVARRGS